MNNCEKPILRNLEFSPREIFLIFLPPERPPFLYKVLPFLRPIVYIFSRRVSAVIQQLTKAGEIERPQETYHIGEISGPHVISHTT